MGYKNFMSKTEDVVRLAYQLKYELGDKISINKIGLLKEVLEGKFRLKDSGRYIDFSILYSDKEFLRVSVGEVGAYASSYEEKVFVLNELKNAISTITRDGVSLGEPSVFYNVRDEKYKVPNLEYIFADKENYIKSFQDKTIFDDATVEDVVIFDLSKETGKFDIVKDYCYVTLDGKSRYSINIYAVLKNKSGMDDEELRNLIHLNLQELFNNDDNRFISYVNYNAIVNLVVYIKRALSYVDEQQLIITIKKDGKNKHYISYMNGSLVKYESSSHLFECDFNTCYGIENGLRFDTNHPFEKQDIIKGFISKELEIINGLINIKNNVKSNENLLKLVRRMGNK